MAPPTVPATRTGTEYLEEIEQRLTPEHFIDEGADADKVFLAGLLQRFDPAPLARMSYREMDRECPEVDRQLVELHGCPCGAVFEAFGKERLCRKCAPPASPDVVAWLRHLAACGASINTVKAYRRDLAMLTTYLTGEHGDSWTWATLTRTDT